MKIKFGDCFQNAVLYIIRNKDDGVYLVHGLVTGTGEQTKGMRFVHAWTQVDDMVIDPTRSLDKPLVTRRERYYLVGHIKVGEVKIYNYKEMVDKMLSYNHYGPWDVKATEEELRLKESVD